VKLDPNFGVKVGYFENAASFGIPVRVNATPARRQTATVDVRWMACSDEICTPVFDTPVTVAFDIAAGAARQDRLSPVADIPPQTPQAGAASGKPLDEFQGELEEAKAKGVFHFLLICFVAGLATLLTPCVFPMIPITVSFFAKRGQEGKSNVGGAGAYCAGIIGTFTVLGILISVLFGATGINALANNPWVNVGITLLLVFFALNLFGVFELRLPSGFVNKANKVSRSRTGFLGPILMGFTFTLTTFTCAVPIVGTLLAAAATGSLLYPTLGMLAFSVAFATPFFLLALFPQYLSRLPKSGGWLASLKAFLGFVELLAAVKFLSNVDLFLQLGLISRAVFLAIWASLMVVCACWLLGWFRFPHEEGRVGFTRRAFGIGSLALAIWFFGGVDGRSLGELNGFLPPEPYPGRTNTNAAIPWMHDYAAALERSRSEGKPVFINFTGVNCTNCRWMESNMFPRKDVSDVLLTNFVPLELWTDRPTPEDRANQKIQLDTTKVVTLPIYAVVDASGKPIKLFSKSTRDPQVFLAFLKDAIESSGGLRVER
jgi:thiol:disulfide interchange protein DsbD